jgi:ligand-binding SRPBCC domain-containing protein
MLAVDLAVVLVSPKEEVWAFHSEEQSVLVKGRPKGAEWE